MRFFARQAAQIDLGGVIFDCKYFSPTFFVDAAEDEKGIEREREKISARRIACFFVSPQLLKWDEFSLSLAPTRTEIAESGLGPCFYALASGGSAGPACSTRRPCSSERS